jgi:hypothetical protein
MIKSIKNGVEGTVPPPPPQSAPALYDRAILPVQVLFWGELPVTEGKTSREHSGFLRISAEPYIIIL